MKTNPQFQIKALVVAVLLTATCHVPPAHAGMFDTLLEILMPSYKADDSDVTDADTNAPATTEAAVNLDRHDNVDAINTTTDNAPTDNTAKAQANRYPPVTSSISVFTDNSDLNDPQLAQQSTSASTSVSNKPSLYNLLEAEFAIDRGNVAHGLALYKQEAFTENAASVFERALSLSMDFEPVDDALYFSYSWQKQNPEHLPAQFYVAHLALKAHNYTLASNILTQILTYDANADLSGILVGIFPDTEADQRELLATLQTLSEHKNASLLTMQAGLLYQLGQYELALFNVGLALEAKPDNVPYITLKADILQKLQPPERVIEYITAQRQRLADNAGARRLYLYEIRYLLKLGQSRAAWALLIDTHQRFSDDTEITLLAALVSIDVEAFETADKLLSSLASLPSYLDQSYYYLGISAERQQNFDLAERYLSKVMREDLVWEARKKVVAIRLLDGDADGAIAILKQLSAQFDIYTPDSIVLQAEILRQQDKIIEAKALLAQANQQYPDNLDILYARSQLLDNSINSDYAIKRTLLERLMLLNPENSDYQISYAQLLFADYDDRARSLSIAKDIINIPYDDPRFNSDNFMAALNLLATDALSNNDYNKVLTYLRTPYEIMPTLESGILLLRAYQGLKDDKQVEQLFIDLQENFAVGQNDISDRLQTY